ncbi:MAG: hypothetical protein MK136_07765 [Pirellulaceae bacterium]|nr:hypothetical protein [Pirellulaceae bacterium]MDP7377478.1 hypothetical protein [Pirellulaceae bacterium]|tara:strand:+ start:353 stop:619 length:267 start_codon:yes stop_codon:yes gene_type:complete
MTIQSSDNYPFPDRRQNRENSRPYSGVERRQFSNSYNGLSEGARELGQAIDQYKLNNRRRYITYEEMYSIISQLGYQKNSEVGLSHES